MEEYASDSLKMSNVSESMDTGHSEEMERLVSDMINYFKVNNDPSLMLQFFNKIKNQLKISGIVKMKNGKVFIEKNKKKTIVHKNAKIVLILKTVLFCTKKCQDFK